MAQTTNGRIRDFCNRNGLSVEFYNKQVESGFKWCYGCNSWHHRADFGSDKSRYDGLTSACQSYRNETAKIKYSPKLRPSAGRNFVNARDGDKRQARRRVNYLVEQRLIPHPNDLPCVDCQHIYTPGGKRHEYDHHLGYDSKCHENVESVCSTCHKLRTNQNGKNK